MEISVGLVNILYDHRVNGEELISHETVVGCHMALCKIIDAYPWAAEIDGFNKYGVGGGFHFILGNETIYACYQYVPMDLNSGMLSLDIVLKPGFLNIFGRKSVEKNFGILSIPAAKVKVKELFQHSVASLYEKYQS